jgi:hypothetical protein
MGLHPPLCRFKKKSYTSRRGWHGTLITWTFRGPLFRCSWIYIILFRSLEVITPCCFMETADILCRIFFLSFFTESWLLTCTFSFSVPHRYKSQGFKSGDRGGHSPRLMTRSPKTIFNALKECFQVCAVALSRIKCSYNISSSVGCSKMGWQNHSHITYGIYCSVKKHEPNYPLHTNCTRIFRNFFLFRTDPIERNFAPIL